MKIVRERERETLVSRVRCFTNNYLFFDLSQITRKRQKIINVHVNNWMTK